MLRLVDLFALLGVAVVVLLPKASVQARPALEAAPVELDRIASAQDALFRDPGDVGAAVRLAEGFLAVYRTDWALATMGPFVEKERSGAPVDARVHLVLATARAERLEPQPALDEAKLVDKACAAGEGTPHCPVGSSARAQLIGGAMQALVEQGIDPQKDPARAKREVYRVLKPSRPDFQLPEKK